jgi:cytochrome b-561
LKLTHATIHGLAFLFTVFGLVAVFDSHNYAVPKIPNLYSLHSWVGLSAVAIFACQYVAGFFCYLFPKVKENVRVFYMPIHVFFGLLGFILALVTVMMGLSEKAFFSSKLNLYLKSINIFKCFRFSFRLSSNVSTWHFGELHWHAYNDVWIFSNLSRD